MQGGWVGDPSGRHRSSCGSSVSQAALGGEQASYQSQQIIQYWVRCQSEISVLYKCSLAGGLVLLVVLVPRRIPRQSPRTFLPNKTCSAAQTNQTKLVLLFRPLGGGCRRRREAVGADGAGRGLFQPHPEVAGRPAGRPAGVTPQLMEESPILSEARKLE